METFGLHARSDGSVLYGLTVESVQDRIIDNISLDLLARLLMDVYVDSSKILDSVISAHQQDILATSFTGNVESRPKARAAPPVGPQQLPAPRRTHPPRLRARQRAPERRAVREANSAVIFWSLLYARTQVNLFLAERIVPKQPAAKYLDRDMYENELRQVLGDTHEAYDLSPEDLVIVGSRGVLVAGPAAKANEPLLLAFLSIRARDLYIQDTFNKLFMVEDTLREARSSTPRTTQPRYSFLPTRAPSSRTPVYTRSDDPPIPRSRMAMLSRGL